MGEGINLYQLRMKHQRAGKTDVEQLRRDTEKYLANHYKPIEQSSDEPVFSGVNKNLDIVAEIWAFVAENIERDAWKSYTREDWEELERQHVEKAHYTEPDLFDDILNRYEKGEITADEARAEAASYRECNYRFCLNVFKPKRKNQYYCSDDCRKREANAKIRFEKTGTYLPPYVYKDNRDDTDERYYQQREIAFNLSEAGAEEGNDLAVVLQQRWYGGKRDRKQETIKDITRYKYNIEETPIIRHYIPVEYRKARTVI